MTFVPSPGVALARISGVNMSQPWAIVLHFQSGTGAAWSQQQINALGQSIQSHWPTSMNQLFSNQVVVNSIECADLTDSVDRSNELLGLSIGGTMPGSSYDLGASVLINKKITNRFRGGHPRTYLPPPATTQAANGDVWQAAHVTQVKTSYDGLIAGIHTDLQSAGLANNAECCPRYTYTYTDNPTKHKWIKTKSGFVGSFPIQSTSVSNQIRSQRRRLGK